MFDVATFVVFQRLYNILTLARKL